MDAVSFTPEVSQYAELAPISTEDLDCILADTSSDNFLGRFGALMAAIDDPKVSSEDVVEVVQESSEIPQFIAPESRKRTRSQRLVQTTLPGTSTEIVEDYEDSSEEVDDGDDDSVVSGNVAKKVKWKDRGYDEYSQMWRQTTRYQRDTFEWCLQLEQKAFKSCDWWLGQPFLYKTKLKFYDFVHSKILKPLEEHVENMRLFGNFMKELPFPVGLPVLYGHPLDSYNTRRIVNVLNKQEDISVSEMVEILTAKQRSIDAKFVCQNDKDNLSKSKKGKQSQVQVEAADVPITLLKAKAYKNECVKILGASFFDFHENVNVDQAKDLVKSQEGNHCWNVIHAFFIENYREYCKVYNANKKSKVSLKTLLTAHFEGLKVSFANCLNSKLSRDKVFRQF